MEILPLEVQSRDVSVKAGLVRAEGLIPANFYGTEKENISLKMDYQTFRRAFKIGGGNTVFELDVDGKNKINVLVHDVQYDPVSDKFTHVDFVFVDLDKEVTTEVPLVTTGESRAVREEGGTLMQNRDTLSVTCVARIIPKQIEFDISSLDDFHSSIHISDITLPEGVTAVDDEKLTLATVVAPKEEEEEPIVAEGEAVEGEEGEVTEGADGEGAAPAEGEKKEGAPAEGGKKEEAKKDES